jgi:DHA3 family macrolide efflux protein-like MFS transporter
VTQSVSVFGSALTLFAITVWLTQVKYASPEQQRQLALAISAVSIAHSLPILLVTPLAGAWADRHDRRLTMMAMDFANGGISVALFLTVLAGDLQIWLLLALVTLASLCSSFHFSSFDSSYAMIVPEKHLPRANGMMQTIFDLSGIIAPGVAAGIIALPALARTGFIPGAIGGLLSGLGSGMSLAIAMDAATFFLASLTLVFLYIPSPKRQDLVPSSAQPAKSIWADIREGGMFVWLRQPLLWLLASFTVANLLGSPIFVLPPLVIKFSLGADWLSRGFSFEAALALMNSFGCLGGVVGGVAVSTWGGLRTRRVYGVLIPMIIAAAAEVAFGLSTMLYFSVAMFFVVGLMIPIMNAHTQTIWQTQTPRELQGRVFAIRRLISRFTLPVSTALAGWVGGVFNPGLVLAAMGALFLVFSIAQAFNRTLLQVEDTERLNRRAVVASE